MIILEDEKNIRLLKKVKEEIYRLKSEVLSGERPADEVDLDKYVEEAKKVLSGETIYESTAINRGIVELFGLKIEALEKIVEKPQVAEVVVLPIASVPSEITLKQPLVSEERKSTVIRERIEQPPKISGERILIEPCKYELKEEKDLLLRILSKKKILVSEWLSASRDKDEYAVRLVALGELLSSGKIRIDENGLLEISLSGESAE